MHHKWRYPNLTLLIISLVVAFLLIKFGWLDGVVNKLGEFGYIGVFIVGIFFVSTFTVAPAGAVLFSFAQDLNPILVGVLGGTGAMLGDYLSLLFIRDRLYKELNPILKALHLFRFKHIFHTRYFAWLTPVVGAIMIASPLPDELGLSLLGLAKIKISRFLLIAFILNAIGILLIALAAR